MDIRQRGATSPDDEVRTGFRKVDLPTIPAAQFLGLHVSSATPGVGQDLAADVRLGPDTARIAEQESSEQPL